MLDRASAEKLLEEKIKDERYLKHSKLVAQIMECLAGYFGEDKEKWYVTGLLHDLDYEETKTSPEKHGILAAEWLKGKLDEDILYAIRAHNFERTGIEPKTKLDYALIAADALSGLIAATVLVMPNKTIDEVKVKTLKKKFKQKDFARKVSRERILFCEKLGLEKEKFFEIVLECLKNENLKFVESAVKDAILLKPKEKV